MPETLTIHSAAKKLNLTRQAVHAAIISEKLKANYESGHWEIHPEDLDKYIQSKYDRKYSKHNGDKVFDMKKGTISIARAARLLEYSYNALYYLVVSGQIPSKRKNKAYVVKIDDINAVSDKFFDGKRIFLPLA